MRLALHAVADHRRVELSGLDDALDGYAEIGQPRWAPWRRKLLLTEVLPAEFSHALDALHAFADPILDGSITDSASWDPSRRAWFDPS